MNATSACVPQKCPGVVVSAEAAQPSVVWPAGRVAASEAGSTRTDGARRHTGSQSCPSDGRYTGYSDPVGYLQFETAALFAQTSPEFSTLANLNEVTKLTVHPRLQFILELNPVAGATGEINQTGFGGMSLGFQTVLLGTGDANTTLAISYLHEVVGSPVPDTDIGTPTNSGILIVEHQCR